MGLTTEKSKRGGLSLKLVEILSFIGWKEPKSANPSLLSENRAQNSQGLAPPRWLDATWELGGTLYLS